MPQDDTQPLDPTATPNDPDWLPDRLDRARHSALRALLDDLGYADVDALKTALTEQAATIQHLTDAQASATADLAAATAARREALIDAAFQLASARYDFHDPAEARLLADFEGVTLDDTTGQVIGMDAALDALVAARPHLVQRPPAPVIDVGTPTTPSHPLTDPNMAEVKRKFRLG
jgi:hypothetical protein